MHCNTNTTEEDEHKKLDMEKVKEFVGDFNELFKNLVKACIKDAKKIETYREYFLKNHPEIFNDSSENEVEMDIDKEKTRPNKPNLAEIKEKLLCKRTEERFTNYEGVMSDPNLTLTDNIRIG